MLLRCVCLILTCFILSEECSAQQFLIHRPGSATVIRKISTTRPVAMWTSYQDYKYTLQLMRGDKDDEAFDSTQGRADTTLYTPFFIFPETDFPILSVGDTISYRVKAEPIISGGLPSFISSVYRFTVVSDYEAMVEPTLQKDLADELKQILGDSPLLKEMLKGDLMLMEINKGTEQFQREEMIEFLKKLKALQEAGKISIQKN